LDETSSIISFTTIKIAGLQVASWKNIGLNITKGLLSKIIGLI